MYSNIWRKNLLPVIHHWANNGSQINGEERSKFFEKYYTLLYGKTIQWTTQENAMKNNSQNTKRKNNGQTETRAILKAQKTTLEYKLGNGRPPISFAQE